MGLALAYSFKPGPQQDQPGFMLKVNSKEAIRGPTVVLMAIVAILGGLNLRAEHEMQQCTVIEVRE